MLFELLGVLLPAPHSMLAAAYLMLLLADLDFLLLLGIAGWLNMIAGLLPCCPVYLEATESLLLFVLWCSWFYRNCYTSVLVAGLI